MTNPGCLSLQKLMNKRTNIFLSCICKMLLSAMDTYTFSFVLPLFKIISHSKNFGESKYF